MSTTLKLGAAVQELLRCPCCGSSLSLGDHQFCCTNGACAACFPLVKGIPVLINEARSLFSISDFVSFKDTTRPSRSPLVEWLSALLPEIGVNITARANYRTLARLLLMQHKRPTVLIVGGSTVGEGMADLLAFPAIDFVETDVTFGTRTALICDGHDLPFVDGAFDGVIIQAVLEHVVDPYRCVAEIHRVLKPHGLVYGETPFMQQVHGGRYDFTRFTHLGHRRLFRQFEEISSGAVSGPGTALSWAARYFLFGFVRSRTAVTLVRAFSKLTLFWPKYFDYYLINKPGTLDGASGYYFMGRRSDQILADRELIKLYKGIL